jgi:hypothetical protein
MPRWSETPPHALEPDPSTLQGRLLTVMRDRPGAHTVRQWAEWIHHSVPSTRKLLSDLNNRGHRIEETVVDDKKVFRLAEVGDEPENGELVPDVFPLPDAIWGRTATEMRAPFTTQMFREAVEVVAPDTWKAMTDKRGPGGKDSGKFYSPANPLYNYLNKKCGPASL